MMVRDYNSLMTDIEKLWTLYAKKCSNKVGRNTTQEWHAALERAHFTRHKIANSVLQRRVNALVIVFYEDFKYISGRELVIYDMVGTFNIKLKQLISMLSEKTLAQLKMIHRVANDMPVPQSIWIQYSEIRNLARDNICVIEVYLKKQ